MLNAVDADVPAGDAYMTLLPPYTGRASMASIFKDWQKDVFEDLFAFPDAQRAFMCPTVAANSVGKTWANMPDGSPVLNAIGKTNNMVASECDDECAWNSKVYNGTAEDVEFTTEYEFLGEWIDSLKAIVQKDLWEDDPEKDGTCLGPGYMWIRFGHGGDGYTETTYGMKRPVYLQSTWLKSRGVEDYPIRYGFYQDLVELVTLCK